MSLPHNDECTTCVNTYCVYTHTHTTDQIGVLESVKAAADIYSPISGKVIEVNTALEDQPELINKDPYSKGEYIHVHT